jgi:hypothetical protein
MEAQMNHLKNFAVWIGVAAGMTIASLAGGAGQLISGWLMPDKVSKPMPLLGGFGKEAGSEAAGKIADALKGIRYPTHIEATVDITYLEDEKK